MAHVAECIYYNNNDKFLITVITLTNVFKKQTSMHISGYNITHIGILYCS